MSPPAVEWLLWALARGYRPRPREAVVFEPTDRDMKVSAAGPEGQQIIVADWSEHEDHRSHSHR
jgi:hypothetical protein